MEPVSFPIGVVSWSSITRNVFAIALNMYLQCACTKTKLSRLGLFGYRLARTFQNTFFSNAMPDDVYLDIWMTILILSHVAV